jgi:universal stress protein E
MARISNILVGVDLHHGDRIATDDWGPATQAAIDQAVSVTAASNARITLCGVLELSEEAHHLIEMDHQNLRGTVEDVAQKSLESLVAKLAARGVTADFVIRFGAAWEELTRQAMAGGHDLVIVGTRSRNLALRFLFGSTAQKLIRYCPVPVWIAKPGEIREIREIAVASDGSEASFAATQVAVSVVQAIPAKLFVVHALEYPFEAYLRTAGVTDEEVAKHRSLLRAEAEQKLGTQLAQTDYRTLKYGVMVEVIEGAPDAVVPQFIVDHEVDLLVIGTNGRSGVSGAVLGNTAERMLPFVHCSLLAIKPAGFVSPVEPA